MALGSSWERQLPGRTAKGSRLVSRTILVAIVSGALGGCLFPSFDDMERTEAQPRLRASGPSPTGGDAGASFTTTDTARISNAATDGGATAASSPGASAASASPKSCKEILAAQRDATSGVYSVSPNGAALQVFCDMTTDGGGWTLVHKNDLSSSSDRTDDGFNVAALLTPDANAVAVLPRATIAALSPSSEFRVLATNGFKIYSIGGDAYHTTDKHDGLPHGGMMKYDWASDYVAQAVLTSTSGNEHGVRVCPASSGCADGDTGHLAVQRFCCGVTPNAGFWFNGTQRFQPGYRAGTGWVR